MLPSFVRASKSFAFAILLLLGPASALAQNTRAELIAREQAAKVERLAPEQAGAFERGVVRVMSSPLLTAQGGVYPWFGSVFPGSGLSGGVGYLGRYPRDAQLSAMAGVSMNGSTRLEASLAGTRFARGMLQPRVTGSWLIARNVAFYGLGQESPDSRVGYQYSPKSLLTELDITPAGWLDASIGYEWLALGTDDGAVPDALLRSAPAFGQDLRYGVTHASITVDSRTSPGYSTRGSFLRAEGADYREQREAPYDFRKTELEVIQLVPILREQFVLAFRGLSSLTHTNDGAQVPLPLLPHIGGGSTVRGFQNRRFADANLLVLTGEYRWRPSRSLDMAIFVDAGQVAPRREDLALNRLEAAWGIGARFHGPAFTALRIEAAHSARGFTFIFAAGPPF